MSIICHGDVENAKKFLHDLSKKRFTFGLVASYTETCEIPGITIAGADKEFLKFTAAADSEYIEYGKCVCISGIPISPDGSAAIISGFLSFATDPLLRPLRKVLPPIRFGSALMDLSPIVAFFGIALLQNFICA